MHIYIFYIYMHRKILEYVSTNMLLVVLNGYEKYRFLKTFVILRKPIFNFSYKYTLL